VQGRSTLGGEGGNLDIQAQRLQLRHGSLITATALGSGNGGNITINAPIILGAENIAFRSPTPRLPTSPSPQPLTEATAWQRTPNGTLELIVDRRAQIPQPATCAKPEIH
jgi:hypothetical protein